MNTDNMYNAGYEEITYKRPMTDDEKIKFSGDLAKLVSKLESVENENKDAMKEFTEQIKLIRKAMDKLSTTIELGEIDVTAKCRKFIDGDTVRYVTDDDTPREVKSRPVQPTDRQTSLLDAQQQQQYEEELLEEEDEEQERSQVQYL